MVVEERLKFWKIGQYSIWGLLNLKYEVNSRQVPDSPPTRQGASERISGLTEPRNQGRFFSKEVKVLRLYFTKFLWVSLL